MSSFSRAGIRQIAAVPAEKVSATIEHGHAPAASIPGADKPRAIATVVAGGPAKRHAIRNLLVIHTIRQMQRNRPTSCTDSRPTNCARFELTSPPTPRARQPSVQQPSAMKLPDVEPLVVIGCVSCIAAIPTAGTWPTQVSSFPIFPKSLAKSHERRYAVHNLRRIYSVINCERVWQCCSARDRRAQTKLQTAKLAILPNDAILCRHELAPSAGTSSSRPCAARRARSSGSSA